MTAISVLDVVNTVLGAAVLITLTALIVRLHATVTIRDTITALRDEVQALALRLRVFEQTAPCQHCRHRHPDDDCCHDDAR